MANKKYILDLTVSDVLVPHANYVLLKLTHEKPLPEMVAGQFAEVRVDGSPTTFLRRPISINRVDRQRNEVWFLVQLVGDGTRKLAQLRIGDKVNVVMPLGNGFTLPSGGLGQAIAPTLENGRGQALAPTSAVKPLLIGGGVGTAPMLMLGEKLVEEGISPTFLLGARSEADLLELELFNELGEVFTTTEDGSKGEKGYVTKHSVLGQRKFDIIYTCGPKPMMVSVARYAKSNGIMCEVSLENMMACGLGACLCCVENTVNGNVCVCKEGPVFNINKLLWQI